MHAYTVYHILSTSSRKGKTAFQEEPGAEQQHLPMEKKKKLFPAALWTLYICTMLFLKCE